MTDESEEWTEWLDHDGGECPCVGMYVHAKANRPGWWADGTFSDEQIGWATGNPKAWDFSVEPEIQCKVIRYRYRKPRALRQLREMIEALPAPERERVEG